MKLDAPRFGDARGLYAQVTGTRHFHLGIFDGDTSGVDLRTALDRTALLGVDTVSRGGRVLDSGCGLGGTTHLLHERGYRAVGIDPCVASIAFATRGVPTHADSPQFVRDTLTGFARSAAGSRRFDAVVQIETLQHLAELAQVAADWRTVAPGGIVLVTDLFANRPLPFDRAPFHTLDALLAAARGFVVESDEELSHAVLPTFDLIRDRLHQLDGEQAGELAAQLGHLQSAIGYGDLIYRHIALRCPT